MSPKKTETNEQAPEDNQDNGMVELHRASVEDIDLALKNAQAQEEVETSAEAPVSDDSAATNETPAPENKKPQGQPSSQERGVATQGAEPSKPVVRQDDLQGTAAENERLRKQGDQKELFIQHRGNELGTLKGELAEAKRQLSATRAQLANGLEDRYHENPVQANNDRDSIKDIDARLEELDKKEARAQNIVEAQTFFLRNVDTEKVTIDDVADVLKSDGIDDKYIAIFKANPWEFTTPEALVQFGRRAMDRKDFTVADNDRRVLAKHVLHLNAELEKLKGRPRQVMAQVQKNLNQSPSVNAASASSPKTSANLNPASVPFMSNAELNAALQDAMRH